MVESSVDVNIYYKDSKLHRSISYAPRTQRQLLQLERLRSDEQPECHGANEHTHDVDKVVSCRETVSKGIIQK